MNILWRETLKSNDISTDGAFSVFKPLLLRGFCPCVILDFSTHTSPARVKTEHIYNRNVWWDFVNEMFSILNTSSLQPGCIQIQSFSKLIFHFSMNLFQSPRWPLLLPHLVSEEANDSSDNMHLLSIWLWPCTFTAYFSMCIILILLINVFGGWSWRRRDDKTVTQMN